MIHNFDYDLICNRLTWISYSQIQYEKSKKNAIKSIKKKKVCVGEVTVLYSAFVLLPNKPRHADSSSFLIHIYFSTNAGFLRSLDFTPYVDPETTQTPPVCSEFLHTDERLEFDGMCLWAVYDSRAMSSPSYRKYRWCSHFNCWEATIWFTRRIVWISLALSLRRLKACWWSYPQDLAQDVVRMQKQPANTRSSFKINLFC